MAHLAYIKITGSHQGLISSGCNGYDSLGSKGQAAHYDEITVLQCSHSMAKRNNIGKFHLPITIKKYIDKASPLLVTAFARQESLECELYFYRTNDKGYNEKFYIIKLVKALVAGLSITQPDTKDTVKGEEELYEELSLSYKDISHEHVNAGTSGYDFWSDTYGESET